jgi:hypothetical protein
MKFRVTMKTPDALEEAIADAVCAAIPFSGDHEHDYCAHGEAECKAKDVCGKWFKSGETLTVEIDTESQTCVVVCVGE